MNAPLPPNEEERLASLRSFDLLDTGPEQAYDDLTLLTAHICETPVAMISLIDENREWFKSKVGSDSSERSREDAFCAHGILQKDLFVVEDALQDERFASNPLVTGDPKIRFYAGSPLITAEGHALGMLCVTDTVPRHLSEAHLNALRACGRQVVAQFELRRALKQKNEMEAQALVLNDALRESEISYRRLFEAAQDGVLLLDFSSGAITDVNPFLTRHLGYSREEMIGKTVIELSPFQDADINIDLLEKLRSQGYVRYEDMPLQTRDGRKIAVEFVSNVYEAGGKKVIQCNIRDITVRKRAESEMNLLKTCVSKLNDIILVTEAEPLDAPGPRIVFVNDAFERITGYTSDEVIGKSPRFLQGEHTDRSALRAIRTALQEQKPIRRKIICYSKSHAEYWVDIDIAPIFDSKGKCTHFAAIQRDVTAETVAQQLTVQQASFLDKARDAIVALDLELKVLFWNEGAERLYGWTREEVMGTEIGERLAKDLQLEKEAYRATLERGEWSGELYQWTKDRREIIVESRRNIIRDQAGEATSILVINTDITEKKKIESQFMRAQRLESIGTLASGVAHDLNNILAPILLSIELLKGDMEREERLEVLDTLETSARRGSDIVRQVLSFARGVEGKRVELATCHLLADLERIIKDTFPRDIRLKFECPEETWSILGDATQIHQILLNLCVNARDAMPRGGRLTVAVENCEVDEQFAGMTLGAQPGRYVRIDVTDTGTGIPQQLIDRIFEPFFTTKELNKSTGLGLSTVSTIVKSHRGFVKVYSEKDKGTRFHVYLPAMAVSSDHESKNVTEPSLPRGNGEMILVVDDEESILLITRQTLTAFGYRVLTALDGADALAIYTLRHNEIDLVLTDIMMPILNGPSLVQILRRINPQVRVIAASGLNNEQNMERVRVSGVKTFLIKPYSAETLLKSLHEVLSIST